MTPAHDQTTTIRLLMHYPEHEPREHDPFYRLFNETRARMKKLGLLVCAISNCVYPAPVELHHDKVEFALQGGVDLDQFNRYYGLHLKDDDAFRAYIEGPGNLEPLCAIHHRGLVGIHKLPGPDWNPLRFWRSKLAPPAEVQE